MKDQAAGRMSIAASYYSMYVSTFDGEVEMVLFTS